MRNQLMFFGAAGLEQPRCELLWWELAISKLGWYSSLRYWDPRGLGYLVKPSCEQCCTKCQDRMKQNKQSRPRNPKKGDGLAFQVRGPWVFWPACGAGLERPWQFFVFSQDGQVPTWVIPGSVARGECDEHSVLGKGLEFASHVGLFQSNLAVVGGCI